MSKFEGQEGLFLPGPMSPYFSVLSAIYKTYYEYGGGVLKCLYVGMDVSKESASAQGIDASGEKLIYLKFNLDSGGFSLFAHAFYLGGILLVAVSQYLMI